MYMYMWMVCCEKISDKNKEQESLALWKIWMAARKYQAAYLLPDEAIGANDDIVLQAGRRDD